MRLLFILTLAIGGCGGASVGEACHTDGECQPLVCNGLYDAPNAPPQMGTCQHPSVAGGLCHRDAECESGLICVLAAGATPAVGGTCQKEVGARRRER